MAGETLANVVEAARMEAERRGHPEVTVEHLVLQPLSVPEVVARLMREMKNRQQQLTRNDHLILDDWCLSR